MKKDNKKIIVVGALVMVLCAVGAFTLLGGGGGSAPAPTAKTATTKGDPKVDDTKPKIDPAQAKIDAIIRNYGNYNAGSGGSRDPFAIPSGAKTALDEGPKQPPVVQAPQPQGEKPTPRPPRFPGGEKGIKPWEMGGPLPNGGSTAPAQIVPRYKVKGVLVGSKPVVVVEDSNGNQRLIAQGGQLDPTTRVTSIEKGQITVNENGKSKTLPIEEGS